MNSSVWYSSICCTPRTPNSMMWLRHTTTYSCTTILLYAHSVLPVMMCAAISQHVTGVWRTSNLEIGGGSQYSSYRSRSPQKTTYIVTYITYIMINNRSFIISYTLQQRISWPVHVELRTPRPRPQSNVEVDRPGKHGKPRKPGKIASTLHWGFGGGPIRLDTALRFRGSVRQLVSPSVR